MRIELLLVPDCPNAEAARMAVTEALTELELTTPVVERVGDFPSPTILINGVDVMNGRSGAPASRACRLDVPTSSQLLDALRAASPTDAGAR